MKTTSDNSRAWKTIKRMLIVVLLMMVARPGFSSLAGHDLVMGLQGDAKRVLQELADFAGVELPNNGSLDEELAKGIEVMEEAARKAESADRAIINEAPFRSLNPSHGAFPNDGLPYYVSPVSPKMVEAARILKASM